MINQDIVTAKLQKLSSNPSPLLPTPVMWFQTSWGGLNHHAINNGDIEVHPSMFPVEFNSESVPDTDTTPIKSIDDE